MAQPAVKVPFQEIEKYIKKYGSKPGNQENVP
jgi:hypothetical protein